MWSVTFLWRTLIWNSVDGSSAIIKSPFVYPYFPDSSYRAVLCHLVCLKSTETITVYLTKPSVSGKVDEFSSVAKTLNRPCTNNTPEKLLHTVILIDLHLYMKHMIPDEGRSESSSSSHAHLHFQVWRENNGWTLQLGFWLHMFHLEVRQWAVRKVEEVEINTFPLYWRWSLWTVCVLSGPSLVFWLHRRSDDNKVLCGSDSGS